jgi:hypothetical protein
MFTVIKDVLHGADVVIQTREGSILMHRVTDEDERKNASVNKVPGKIMKTLGTEADNELRNTLVWPRK